MGFILQMRVPYHEYFPGERSRRGKSLFIHRIWKAVDLIDIHNFSFRRNFLLEKIILIKILSKLELFYPGSYFPASTGEAELLEGEIVTSL